MISPHRAHIGGVQLLAGLCPNDRHLALRIDHGSRLSNKSSSQRNGAYRNQRVEQDHRRSGFGLGVQFPLKGSRHEQEAQQVNADQPEHVRAIGSFPFLAKSVA